MPSHDTTGFIPFLSHRITARAEVLTRLWIDRRGGSSTAPARSPEKGHGVAAADIVIVERIAGVLANPRPDVLDELIGAVSRRVEVRRRVGVQVDDVLWENGILASTLQEECEAAVKSYDFTSSDEALAVARAVGRLRAATDLMSEVAASSFRRWQGRYQAEREDVLGSYSQALGHELGNRLGAAKTAIQLLRSDLDVEPDRVERLHDLALSSITSGLRTVQDFQALTTSPVDSPVGASIGLPILLRETVRAGRAEAEQAGIRVEIEGGVPDVRVAGPHLRLALRNLLGNAIEHHARAQPERWVRVSCQVGDGEVTVSVTDNGPGVAEDERERIFQFHSRGPREEKVSGEGGLGLAITREAIERAGGSVTLDDATDGGARFVLRVPVLPKPEDAGP